MNEFDIIRTYFAPLSQPETGALNLSDDAALLDIPSTHSLVCTKDALTENVHFFARDTPDNIAKKLLGVNLSDLAAMGATPLAYLLALHLPTTTSASWLEQFSRGLKEYLAQYGGTLIGGDTTMHDGPLCLSLTALGTLPKGKALLRSGAKAGDAIYVSGYIGDSYVGLSYLQQKIGLPTLSEDHYHYVTERYYLPNPRLQLGTSLRDLATSCIDISDGLIADLWHLCDGSHLNATLIADSIPRSDAAIASTIPLNELITGGDDYELLFTIAPDAEALLPAFSDTPLIRIGYMTETGKQKITLLDTNGHALPLPKKTGYKHIIK